ncbi:rac GTPase-activating protein 1 [Neocloeon triangulifer]|uniref:rac GTPase-activating protein 1 n=1 Tax=Neocloeon triangulifer TaxID=2078957 RepID=UPI00286F2A1D|nr:rac GTPase-activating protein 1 [Neocloeon triangulifer]
MVLSTVAQFDEMCRLGACLSEGVEEEFLAFCTNQEDCRKQWLQAVFECQRLQAKLADSNHALSEMENKLEHARNLLDQEKRQRRKIEHERDALEKQISLVRDMLENNKVNDETREKLAFLGNISSGHVRHESEVRHVPLDVINEFETTGSILSELGYSQSDDEMEVSILRNGKTRRRSSRPYIPEDAAFMQSKRRRSSKGRKSIEMEVSGGHLVATTTVTVTPQIGSVKARSKMESVAAPSAPPMEDSPSTDDSFWKKAGPSGAFGPGGDAMEQPAIIGLPSTLGRINSRNHVFCTKNIIKPETCGPCKKKIKFAAKVMKCVECRAVCHPDCKDDVPLPCVPMGVTPMKKMGCIADFTTMTPPMVPAIVIHCIKEVEKRGSTEIGIYRVPGSERDVKALKERFLKGKGAPDLSQTDIHTICGTLKEFLRSLKEPLVTQSQWKDFTRACEHRDPAEVKAAMYTAIAELPQPNRDTLAFLIMHLQRVAGWEECKMPIGNLAKVFGPTIVGYSTDDMDAMRMVTETRMQQNVMTELLNIPSDYWANFLNKESEQLTTPKSLFQTPSSASLRRQSSLNKPGFFTNTPRSARMLLGKRDKFFSTPDKY